MKELVAQFQGRFVDLLSPKLLTPEVIEVTRVMLAMKGLNEQKLRGGGKSVKRRSISRRGILAIPSAAATIKTESTEEENGFLLPSLHQQRAVPGQCQTVRPESASPNDQRDA